MVALSGLFITGCVKDDTLTIKPTVTVITKTVSFKTDLVPLFVANCAVSGCHDARNPVLKADLAYNSLVNGKFIDTKTPASSIIYKRLTGVLSPAMPFGKPTNPGNINGLVLAWITQGGKNN